MKTKLIYVFLIITTICSLAYSQDAGENRKKFDPKSNPLVDLKLAVELATKEHKRILLDVGGEWCIWCHRLDAFIEEHAELKNTLESNFVVVKVNVSKENNNESFLSQYPTIPGYPHIFVLETDGKLLHSQDTSKLEKDKSYNAELLLSFLTEWAPKK